MFDSHIEDLIENRVMNDEITSNKSSPSLRSIQPQISRGLKDLINHPLPKSNLSDIGSVGSQNSSKSTTPQLNKKSKTTAAINSSIKFANRKDQSLREVVEEWRTDFYPDLSYDYFNENPILSSSSNNNNNDYNFNGNKNNEKEDNEEEEDEDDHDNDDDDDDDNENSSTEDSDEDSDKDNDESKEEENDNVKNNSTYNEYINNLNNMKDQKVEQVQEESLLEQRVKQWKSDIRTDILESSELFMEHLPQRVFEKKVISELPMTPSTKKEPIQSPSNSNNNNNNTTNSSSSSSSSGGGGKSQFEYWRDNFNKTMDEKMKEKKRTNKITITSNK
ncbi:hypothetical protein ACTFIW_013043 [Dictyostelium discoideum]